jgi:hypothetical protein
VDGVIELLMSHYEFLALISPYVKAPMGLPVSAARKYFSRRQANVVHFHINLFLSLTDWLHEFAAGIRS